jgi:hypothetical protein
MLLILAHRDDRAARSLAERWHSRGALILTARDLSRPGWSLDIPGRRPSRFAVGSRNFSILDLSGVLTRVFAVPDQELGYVAPEDRSYVSSEMSAFLLAWLSSLSCPVLNRPTPGCLCGPNWRIERWIHLAAQVGIPVDPIRRSTTAGPDARPAEGIRLTFAGEECVGDVHPVLENHARRLAKAAQVELLELQFSSSGEDGRLQNVSLWPDISQPAIADAVLHRFESRAQ